MDHQAILISRDKDENGEGGWTYLSANDPNDQEDEDIQYDTLDQALASEEIGADIREPTELKQRQSRMLRCWAEAVVSWQPHTTF
jgi:hypothetical protein